MIQCVEGLSTARHSETAFAEVVAKLKAGLNGLSSDLTVIFSTQHHADKLAEFGKSLRANGLGRVVIGCTCESIVGEGEEIEGTTGLSIWTASLPDVELIPFSVEGDAGWPANGGAETPAGMILLADPFRFPIDNFFHRIALERPGTRIMGGMASGARTPGQNQLLLDEATHAEGAVGVIIRGNVAIRSVVSQGCRPIGETMLITKKTDRNIISELGRRPALEVVQEVFEGVSEAEQEMMRSGLHVGRVINEYQESFGPGDFLVRNVMGADPSGGLAISDLVKVGQTVQFHVRDAETADEDLRNLLIRARADGPAAGALIFTCNGRGSRLFMEPHHDVKAVREQFGPIAAAGFFAMGELGPVGGQNFMHGFTASVVLFSEPIS